MDLSDAFHLILLCCKDWEFFSLVINGCQIVDPDPGLNYIAQLAMAISPTADPYFELEKMTVYIAAF